MLTRQAIKAEVDRILKFICDNVQPWEKVVIPVSGGLDSEVSARLCALALGKERIRLFTVLQEGLEEKYTANAVRLARELDVRLDIIRLGDMNRLLIEALHEAAPDEDFLPDSLLDPARANCSLRTAILSTYQDKGYVFPGNSNRTELEMGFFLPLGDNLGHFKPIAHLYKSEVFLLAELIGCSAEIIRQPPSAGFWEGETDLEDMAYWIYNKGPIPGGRVFSDEEDAAVAQIYSLLTQERIDSVLIGIHEGNTDSRLSAETGLPEDVVHVIRETRERAAKTKNRPLLRMLDRIS